jgi:hypothetical protein
MEKITINGRTSEVSGRNITIVNRRVYVDGKLVEEIPQNEAEETVHIKWEGFSSLQDTIHGKSSYE